MPGATSIRHAFEANVGISTMLVVLYRSCRLAFMAHILLAGLLLDDLQALQQGNADAVWENSSKQSIVSFLLCRVVEGNMLLQHVYQLEPQMNTLAKILDYHHCTASPQGCAVKLMDLTADVRLPSCTQCTPSVRASWRAICSSSMCIN